MLDFCDAPYRFFPAKPNRFLMGLAKAVNRFLILPGKNHRVVQIDLCGEIEAVRDLARQGKRLLLVANHSTHSDPQVMTEVQRQLGVRSCFMAAYDVFLRGKVSGWLMQRFGCFSIDREGSDRKAMAEAARILKEGKLALTIFPEGNVYLTNDRVTPFLEGAAFFSLKSQKELGDAEPIYAVPMAFKFSHLTDVRDEIRAQLNGVAAGLGTEFDVTAAPLDELKRIGRELLIKNLRQRGVLDPEEISESEEFGVLLRTSVDRILDGLEKKIDLPDGSDSDAVERIRKARSMIHQILSDPEREIDHRVATTWADEAILAFRIFQYATPYVFEKPTVDRFAETVERLQEDLTGSLQKPIGRRHVEVRVCAPIALPEVLADAPKLRAAVSDLTSRWESSIQEQIDLAAGGLETVGAELF